MAPILGSVIRLEEEDAGVKAAELKNALSAPYAALGDSFFWGAFRPFAGIAAAVVALFGYVAAPLVMLCIYNIPHLWIRIGGFVVGYRKGKESVTFIRDLDLHRQAGWIRWMSVIVLSIFGVITARSFSKIVAPQLPTAFILLLILFLFFAIRKGLSQIIILYGSAIVLLGIGFFLC
jgi:PTS system mannose-specific IID component